MSKEAKTRTGRKSFHAADLEGSEGEKAVDVSSLRANTGYITLDDGYGNTGSCVSKITFIDGDKGILRYRGIPIEELAEKSNFIETAYLIIYGSLPTRPQFKHFSDLLAEHQFLHEDMKYHFEGFPTGAHPMAILSSMINAASCFDEGLMNWKWGKMKQFDTLRGQADFAGADHRGVFVSQIARAAADLSEADLQIHGELPAHAVLDAV
jgi:citrate synthase